MAVAQDSDIESYEELAGKSVAVKTGTEGYSFAEQLAKEIGFEMNAFQDSTDMHTWVTTVSLLCGFRKRCGNTL